MMSPLVANATYDWLAENLHDHSEIVIVIATLYALRWSGETQSGCINRAERKQLVAPTAAASPLRDTNVEC